MKRYAMVVSALFCFGYALAGDVSLVERAKELFSEARINDPAVVYGKSQECVDFKREWNACADETTVAEVNRILLTALTSFKAVVSTNEVDAGASGVMIQDRRVGLAYPRFAWRHVCKVPKEDLLTLARYIGTLQAGVYVRNPHTAGEQAAASERRRESRIRSANIWLSLFRRNLLFRCRDAVVDLKRTLPRAEYGEFIRAFVKEGKLSEAEIVDLLSHDITRESNGDPCELYKTTYDNPLNWYAWNTPAKPSVEERIKALIERINHAVIEGDTLTEKLTACQIMDEEVCAVQSELWEETHNVTNLLAIWRRERQFFEQDASRTATSGIREQAKYPPACRTTMQRGFRNRRLADKVLNEMRERYSSEEFSNLKNELDDIIGHTTLPQ